MTAGPTEQSGVLTNINENTQFEDLSGKLMIIGHKEKSLFGHLPMAPDAADWKHIWQEDEYRTNVLTLGVSISAGATSMTVPSADQTKYRVDEFIRMDSEDCLVTAVSGTTVTITRAQHGTSAAAHTSADAVILMGRTVLPTSAWPTAGATVRSEEYNVVEHFHTPIAVSDLKQMSAQPGGAEMPYQRAKQWVEHINDIEYAALYQSRADLTATIRGALGGIIPWISTNITTASATDSTTAALTYAIFEGWLADIWQASGSTPDLLVINGTAAKTLAGFGYAKFETNKVGPQGLGLEITTWMGPFGRQQILMSNKLDSRPLGKASARGVILAINRKFMGWSWMQSQSGEMGRTHLETKAKTGPQETKVITSALTLERRHEKAHGYLYGFHVNG